MQRGGKRPGAGRPKVAEKIKTFSVTCYPSQIAEIRKFAKSLKDASSSNQSD